MPHQDLTPVFNWLNLSDAPQKADLIIGFGHFDMKIPDQCLQLYRDGLAPKVLFTGGIGAGTADLDMPEARAFLAHVQNLEPNLALADFLVEDRSTNTGENVRNSQELLAKEGLHFGEQIRTVLLVANPFRQRRVWLTCKLLMPNVTLYNCPPPTTYAQEIALFQAKNQNLAEQLPGEVKRIQEYPQRGFIAPSEVPDEILKYL